MWDSHNNPYLVNKLNLEPHFKWTLHRSAAQIFLSIFKSLI